MARRALEWIFRKGGEAWRVVETIRLSPAPKTGGWAGNQIRLLSASRGQSVITDLEHGTLALNRRCKGLPSIQRIWSNRLGFSLGYTKPRGSPDAAELFFLDSEARLVTRQRLPTAAIDASAGDDQWYIACRNGRITLSRWRVVHNGTS